MNINFKKLINPTPETAQAFSRWENDPRLIPVLRPNKNKKDLEKQQVVTIDDLTKRIEYDQIYLIYLDKQLIGQMSYQVDFDFLYKKESSTAWIGIGIGEGVALGKGSI